MRQYPSVAPSGDDAPGSFAYPHKVLIVAGVAALMLFVWEVVPILALLFAGVLLGLALRGLGNAVARWSGLSEVTALGVSLAVLAGGLTGCAWFIGAELSSQFDRLIQAAGDGAAAFRDSIARNHWGGQALHLWSNLSWAPSGGGLVKPITGAISAGAQGVSAVGIVFGVGLYLAYSPETYRRGVLALVPATHRGRAGEVLDALSSTLRRWAAGRSICMAVVGVATAIGLYFLGSPAPLALGLLTGLILIIPFFGPILATIPAALASLPDGPVWALAVVGLYVGLQIAEGFLLIPLITERTVELPAALVIGNQVLLGATLGLTGVLIATPIAAAGLVLVRMLYIQDTLGEEPGGHGGARDQGESASSRNGRGQVMV